MIFIKLSHGPRINIDASAIQKSDASLIRSAT